jgi:hypothetical protein
MKVPGMGNVKEEPEEGAGGCSGSGAVFSLSSSSLEVIQNDQIHCLVPDRLCVPVPVSV